MSGCSSLYMSAVSTRKSQKKALTAAQRERASARNADIDGASTSMYPSSLGVTKKSTPSVRTYKSRSSASGSASASGSTPTLTSLSLASRSAPLSPTSTRAGSVASVSTAARAIAMISTTAEAGPSRSRSNTAPTRADSDPRVAIPPPPRAAPPEAVPSPEPDRADLHEVEVMQMARMKLSNRDQEAMRRMRAQMVGSPDWTNTSPRKGVDARIPDQPTIPELPEAGPSRLPKPYDHTVVVLGAQGVGKTTFIERAIKSWDCSPPARSTLPSGAEVSISICAVPPSSRVDQSRTIRFIELDSASIDVDSPSFWPDGVGEVSGVLLCYDGTRASSLNLFDVYLERIAKQGLPMVMLACKSDPGAVLEVEAAHGNSLGEPHGTGLIEVSSETGEGRSKMRNGLRWLLYKIEQRARRQLRHLGRLQIPSVPRSPSSHALASHNRTSPPKAKASSPPSLASSTYTRRPNGHVTNGHDVSSPTKTHYRSTRTLASSVEGEGTDHRSSGSSFHWMMNGPFSPTDASTVEGDETGAGHSKRSSLKAVAGNGNGVEDGKKQMGMGPVLEKETEIRPEGVRISRSRPTTADSSTLVQEGAVPIKPDGQAPMWLSLDILFTKLFSFVVANEDERFITSFFLTYRRFCSPLTLMSEFRTRFKEVEDAPIVADAKNWALMKITGQLIDWIAEYPGDLADTATRNVLQEYKNAALQYTFMAHLTAELIHLGTDLDGPRDIDYSWCISNPANKPKALSDTATGSAIADGPLLELPARDTSSTSTPADTPISENAPAAPQQAQSVTSLVSPSTRSDSTPTNSIHGSAGISGTHGAVPPVPLQAAGSKLRQSSERAVRSVSSSSISLAGQHLMYANPIGNGHSAGANGTNGASSEEGTAAQAQWATAFAMVADGDVRSFAIELTKMQWRVFMAIRPRDVLRHDLGKEENDPVAAAIYFFNRLSRWVSTVILSNPKPKHRARVYERFILIAHQLRRLNNYDSLYALISGMKETSIHRLSQTHALISPLAPGQKEFQSHSKLMDPRGGYTLYRRALEADVDNENTAIPLLTSIISMINRLQSVRREDVRKDGDVQWDKFAKFGQILSVITEFQARGPMVSGEASPSFRAMISDMPVIMSEDGLFERSRMLEPSNGHTVPPRDGRIMGLLQGKQKWAATTMTGYDYR